MELGIARGSGLLRTASDRWPIYYEMRVLQDGARIHGEGWLGGETQALWAAKTAGSARLTMANGREFNLVVGDIDQSKARANFISSGLLPHPLTLESPSAPEATHTDSGDLRVRILEELQKAEPSWSLVEAWTREVVDSDPSRVRFSVDAGHIQRLGTELVARQDTALSELIKNAYDADATSVTLTFKRHNRRGGILVIEDDGQGMSEEVIRNAWMRISTTEKVEVPFSPLYARRRSGRKGIGRFAAQRLGKILELESRPAGAELGYRVRFSWDSQFSPGQDLTQVFSTIERFNKNADDHGTRLIVKDLRDSWSPTALERVWRSVLLLQPPFKGMTTFEKGPTDPGFSVVINDQTLSDKRELFSIEKSFLSQAIAEIDATIADDGTATVTVKSDKLNLRDTQTYADKYTLTGPVSFHSYYFIYLPSTLSGMGQQAAGEMGRKYGGLRVYRNGFRVLPYGEASDDWLELDLDVSRRQLLVPANNRNFFGHVELNKDANPLFEETSSREGLLQNEAYDELVAFVRQAVEWAATRVAAARNRKQGPTHRDYVAEALRPSELLKEMRSSAAISPVEVEQIDQALEAATKFEELTDAVHARSLQYEEMLRLLASLGVSISVFGHEVKGARDAIVARLLVLQDIIERDTVGELQSTLTRQHSQLKAAADRVFDIGGYIANLVSSSESRQLRSLSLAGSIERFVAQFKNYMDKQGVEFELDIDPISLRTTPMHGSELDSVLLNFLTNSMKAMRKARPKQKRIRIEGRAEGGLVVLAFEDTGIGIPAEYRDRVFDAFFTTTMGTDDDGLAGPGTGLGLKIVSDIAQSYGGDARVADPSNGYACRVEFRVMRGEGDAT